MSPTERVLELALAEGFDLAGVAPLRAPRDLARFEAWLAAGRHAGMGWLDRSRPRIADPSRLMSGARSLLVVGWGHGRPAVELADGGRVARYAAGRDYHNAMRRRLRKLGRRLAEAGLAGRARAIVDAGPLLERSHAAEAGLGFPSKAANLLHHRHGPWFFLGELLLDVELEPTTAPAPGSCGTCRACLDACPTAAILEPGVVDANRCISYHTIESRAPVPEELRPRLVGWAFGCDVCSEVCPFGARAPDASERLGTHPSVAEGSLVGWLGTPAAAFRERFHGSPLQRPHRDGLARNAALALGHAPTDGGRAALTRALEADASPLVRESAGWSLAYAHGLDRGVRDALERALAREPDPAARRGLERSRRRLG